MEKAASMYFNEVFDALNASPSGLATEEAETRLKKYGFNTLVEKKQTPIFYKFLAYFKDLFGILLLFASALSLLVDPKLSLIILAVVLVNIFFSLFQESRAEKAMVTLKSWMPEYAKVIRNGELRKILVKEIVPRGHHSLGGRLPYEREKRRVQLFCQASLRHKTRKCKELL